MLQSNKNIFKLCITLTLLFLVIVQPAGVTYQKNTIILDNSLSMDSPLLASSFLGGSNNDGNYYTGVNIIQDGQGNIFIAGTTESSDFPVTLDSYSNEYHGDQDVFVTKMNSELTTVLASTYVGGGNTEEARGIGIDQSGNIFVCGITESTDFPCTPNAFQVNYHGGTTSPYGSGDAFVIKLNNDLTEVISSTFLGGRGHEYCSSIDIDSKGNVIVTGGTSSVDFPITAYAYDGNHHSGGNFGDDVYIAKLSNDLSSLLSSTYVGGNNDDIAEGIIVDSYDTIYVTGWLCSSDFPTTATAYDITFGGGYYDGFISRFDNNLTILQSSTFLGGSQWDFCYGITIDADENVYVTGHTASRNYPVSPTAFCKSYQGLGGPDVGDDVFVSKLNENLSALLASTFLGGAYWEIGYSILSHRNMIYIAGSTSSSDFPTTNNSFSIVYHGGTKYTGDVFLSCFNEELSLLPSSTYLGDLGSERAGELFVDASGEVFISGSTSSLNFPITEGCFDPSYNGVDDVFISKFHQGLSMNTPPEKPEISGPSSGKSGQTYEYIAVTNDAENDEVYYLFDWGNGDVSDWLGSSPSGESYVASYSWSEKGTYEIKAKAKDVFGLESEWSDPLPITMPYSYNKPLSQFLDILFQRFPNTFPLLRHLLRY